MNSNTKPKAVGWAKVPHGIIDAAITETLKLLLWYCYDKPEDWTFSVPDVARSLDKTPQCIRKYFRQFADASVFTKTSELPHKHGLIPLYSFHRHNVDAFIKSQLKLNPETDPETDRETDPETDVERNPETDPATVVSDTKKDIPIISTETTYTEKQSTKGNGTNGIDGSPSLKSPSGQNGVNLAKEFESFLQDARITMPNVSSNSSVPFSGETQAAEGGVQVGAASTPLASTVPSIQSAYGNSNGGDKDKPDEGPVCTSGAVIQGSAKGNTNTAAQPINESEHRAAPTRGAAGTIAKSGNVRGLMPRDAEWCAERLIRSWKGYRFAPESLRTMETEFRKRLAETDWSSCTSSFLAMCEVKRLKEQIQKEFGRYE